MKYWIDPPGGWMLGFPMVWDEDNDPPMEEWIRSHGYTDAMYYVRTWPYEEVML